VAAPAIAEIAQATGALTGPEPVTAGSERELSWAGYTALARGDLVERAGRKLAVADHVARRGCVLAERAEHAHLERFELGNEPRFRVSG